MRVLKWPVPVDDHQHPIGPGEVIHVGHQGDPDVVYVWTVEEDGPRELRLAVAIGTGMEVPASSDHIGSSVWTNPGDALSLMVGTRCLVWHVFAEVQS